jgi:hypothetical protein
MSAQALGSNRSDCNLLFGTLAVQMDFITKEALVAGMGAWVMDKTKSLGQILVDQGVLTPARQALLDALVQEHLAQHGGDVTQSLAALPILDETRSALDGKGDAAVHAALASLPDPNATISAPDPIVIITTARMASACPCT